MILKKKNKHQKTAVGQKYEYWQDCFLEMLRIRKHTHTHTQKIWPEGMQVNQKLKSGILVIGKKVQTEKRKSPIWRKK